MEVYSDPPGLMSLSASELQDLQNTLADRLYVQISGWHLYLGDADLAPPWPSSAVPASIKGGGAPHP